MKAMTANQVRERLPFRAADVGMLYHLRRDSRSVKSCLNREKDNPNAQRPTQPALVALTATLTAAVATASLSVAQTSSVFSTFEDILEP